MDKKDFRIKKMEMTRPENLVYPVDSDSDKK